MRNYPGFRRAIPHFRVDSHALLTRSPLNLPPIARRQASCDLHVLSTPPAFALSQNQTLRNEEMMLTSRPKPGFRPSSVSEGRARHKALLLWASRTIQFCFALAKPFSKIVLHAFPHGAAVFPARKNNFAERRFGWQALFLKKSACRTPRHSGCRGINTYPEI
ncbi:protein of unknown function [Methylacidimicrobium sp. AP8]|nr:protein of unknown function [Methylacidimicrobium sp. AP8]